MESTSWGCDIVLRVGNPLGVVVQYANVVYFIDMDSDTATYIGAAAGVLGLFEGALSVSISVSVTFGPAVALLIVTLLLWAFEE